jgi:hypothetical protein
LCLAKTAGNSISEHNRAICFVPMDAGPLKQLVYCLPRANMLEVQCFCS